MDCQQILPIAIEFLDKLGEWRRFRSGFGGKPGRMMEQDRKYEKAEGERTAMVRRLRVATNALPDQDAAQGAVLDELRLVQCEGICSSSRRADCRLRHRSRLLPSGNPCSADANRPPAGRRGNERILVESRAERHCLAADQRCSSWFRLSEACLRR